MQNKLQQQEAGSHRNIGVETPNDRDFPITCYRAECSIESWELNRTQIQTLHILSTNCEPGWVFSLKCFWCGNVTLAIFTVKENLFPLLVVLTTTETSSPLVWFWWRFYCYSKTVWEGCPSCAFNYWHSEQLLSTESLPRAELSNSCMLTHLIISTSLGGRNP